MLNITPKIELYNAPGKLQDMIIELCMKDAALNSAIPSSLKRPTTELLKIVNSYYSNRIEGNPTKPRDVLKSQEETVDGEQDTDGILEIKRDVEVQTQVQEIINKIDSSEIAAPETIKNLHKSFYKNATDEQLRVYYPNSKKYLTLVPGETRNVEVDVGNHIPPNSNQLNGHMEWFKNSYRLDCIHGTAPFLAAAAAHHRLMYIHPFIDGNGRVGRLFTSMYLKKAGLGGLGLWSINRGFGRDKEAYYSALSEADKPRQGSTDGRGILSDRGLLQFTEYFIETALDQVNFFSGVLEPKMMNSRIDAYFEMRNRGSLPDRNGNPLKPLHPNAQMVYHRLLNSGPQSRSDIQSYLNISERTLRVIIKEMSEAGLVKAPKRQPVELAISPSSLQFLFPNLW